MSPEAVNRLIAERDAARRLWRTALRAEGIARRRAEEAEERVRELEADLVAIIGELRQANKVIRALRGVDA